MLLLGQEIQPSGAVNSSRFYRQHNPSDWMAMEQQRCISMCIYITTSVMQFTYHQTLIYLLDTPRHEDFSEDTSRRLLFDGD